MTEFPSAVLFDLDGTLLDTLEDLGTATNRMLADMGLPQHPLNAYRQFLGGGLKMLVKRALPPEDPAHTDPKRMASLIEQAGKHYEACLTDTTRPYDGIPDLLNRLQETGRGLAVVTNKPHLWAERIIRHFFPSVPFALVLGSSEMTPHKPNPLGALKAASELRTSPKNTAFVGDSDVDIQTARNAGMVSFGAAWGFRGEMELRRSGADFILQHPHDMIHLIQSGFNQPSIR
ncbi:MAG: HAD family hydrolase [Desulfovibrionaceae bacterium]|nr:HAD family hydrolase [Desulfovibrionaceae bacterium]